MERRKADCGRAYTKSDETARLALRLGFAQRHGKRGSDTMLAISLVFAAGAAFINIWLALRCGSVRTKEKILHGDGGSTLLGRRMRAHANFAEFTPIVLILFILVEYTLGSSIWLWAVAALYLVGRVLHAIGMDAEHAGLPRMIGIVVTMLITLGLAITAAYGSVRIGQGYSPAASSYAHP
jgi:uncharacterized protein